MRWTVGIAGLAVGAALVAAAAGRVAFPDPDHASHTPTAAEVRGAGVYATAALTPWPEGVTPERFEGHEVLRLSPAAAPHGTVLVVPGFTAPGEMYGATFAAMSGAGYEVVFLSTVGQGRSPRPLANPEKAHLTDYSAPAGVLARLAEAEAARGPVHVIATSQGGHIALRAAAEHAMPAASLALIVPMVKIDTGDFPYPVARALSEFYSLTGLSTRYAPGRGDWRPGKVGEPDSCNANPATAWSLDALFTADPDLRVGGPTFGWVRATMRSTDWLTANAGRIAQPVLMFTAGDDRIVSTPAASALCKAAPNCVEQRYPEARHCLTLESAARRDEVLAEALRFFAEAER